MRGIEWKYLTHFSNLYYEDSTSKVSGKIISLCQLCGLCVSVVEVFHNNHHGDAENTEPAQSLKGIPTDSTRVFVLGGDLAGVEALKLLLDNSITLATGSFQPFTIQDCDLTT